jgi:hypothetical protein
VIDFIVIGLPRSGTAWAANWLTTDATICLHDPEVRWDVEALDGAAKRLGIASTSLWTRRDWLNSHPARKVILHRDPSQITDSLDRLGFAALPLPSLNGIDGLHVDWTDLWDNPQPIWEHLMDTPFNAERHALLKELNVQVDFDRVTVDRAVAARYLGKFA